MQSWFFSILDVVIHKSYLWSSNLNYYFFFSVLSKELRQIKISKDWKHSVDLFEIKLLFFWNLGIGILLLAWTQFQHGFCLTLKFFLWNFSLLLFMLWSFICEQNFMNSYLCNLSTPIFRNKMMNVTMLMMVKIMPMRSPQQENMIQMMMILTPKKPQWHKEMWWWVLVEGGRVGGERSLQSLFKGDQFIRGVN
jgi:hypothetical protein